MPTTWEELVESVTARHPVREGKMFGMPCLKRGNGKVVAGQRRRLDGAAEERRCRLGRRRSGNWKDGGLTVKLTDEAQREAALAAGAEPFDPGMGRPLRRRQSRHLRVSIGSGEPAPMREWVLVPASQSDDWERLVEQAIG